MNFLNPEEEDTDELTLITEHFEYEVDCCKDKEFCLIIEANYDQGRYGPKLIINGIYGQYGQIDEYYIKESIMKKIEEKAPEPQYY